MSRENIELVTRALTAVAKRPRPDFETINALYDPEHVFVSIPASKLGEAEAVGAPGFKAWLEGQEAVMVFDFELDGVVDIAPDVVLAATTVRFHGAASGIDSELRTWTLVTVSDGKITRSESYLDPGEALEVVGERK